MLTIAREPKTPSWWGEEDHISPTWYRYQVPYSTRNTWQIACPSTFPLLTFAILAIFVHSYVHKARQRSRSRCPRIISVRLKSTTGDECKQLTWQVNKSQQSQRNVNMSTHKSIVSLGERRRRFPLSINCLVINKGRSWEVKFVGILGESACWALLAGLLELWHGYRHPWRIRARFTRVGRMSYANHEYTLVYSYYSPSFLRCWRLLVLHRRLRGYFPLVLPYRLWKTVLYSWFC